MLSTQETNATAFKLIIHDVSFTEEHRRQTRCVNDAWGKEGVTPPHICISFILKKKSHLWWHAAWFWDSQSFSFISTAIPPQSCLSAACAVFVCSLPSSQPPACRLIEDNYSYFTVAFTAWPLWEHLQTENTPSWSSCSWYELLKMSLQENTICCWTQCDVKKQQLLMA